MMITLFGLLFLSFLIGIPIAWSFGLISFAYLHTSGFSFSIIIQRLGSGMDSFTLLAIPLFMLAGEVMNTGGITRRIIALADSIVGHMTAGLGQVNIFASLIFSGMSGSAVADTSALGTILIPSMEKRGYPRPFSAAVTAASSTIGPIVPPSIPIVIYGITAGVSIVRLFLAGFLPGLLMTVTLMVMNFYIGKKKNIVNENRFSFPKFFSAFKSGIWPILMPVIIVGGMVTGKFTPTEAAGVGVLYGIILGVLYRELTIKNFIQSLRSVAYKTGIVVVLIGFATIIGWIMSMEQIPVLIANWLTGLTSNIYLILLFINVFLLIIGLFMEANAAILILAPVLVPVITRLGIDPIHFGIIMVLNLMIGLITPPVGACLYMVSEVADIKVEKLIYSVLPFLVPLIITLLIVTYFPQLVLFIPKMLMP